MKTIESELRELLCKRISEAAFRRLWTDFEDVAARWKSLVNPAPVESSHPPGYRERYRNLDHALRCMKPEDWEQVWIKMLGGILREEDKYPDGNTGFSADWSGMARIMPRMRKTIPFLADQEFNPPHRRPAADVSMRFAIALWRKHVKKPIGTNNKGPFATFARLFFRQMKPDFTPKAKKDNLQRRIRAAMKKEPLAVQATSVRLV